MSEPFLDIVGSRVATVPGGMVFEVVLDDLGAGDLFGNPAYGVSYDVIVSVAEKRLAFRAEAGPQSTSLDGYLYEVDGQQVGTGGDAAPLRVTARMLRGADRIQIEARLRTIRELVPIERGDRLTLATAGTQRLARPTAAGSSPFLQVSPTADTASADPKVGYRVGHGACG